VTITTDRNPLDSLDVLVDDARHLPAAILPRPRKAGTDRVVDLTATQLRIPSSTAHLMDGYDDYGS
jgi:hypothetical protein